MNNKHKDPPQCVFPSRKRIIAIGDIHGDWGALVQCLTIANVIDDRGRWIGGSTYVVQLGDCLDRYRAIGNSEPAGELATKSNEKSESRILKYLWRLDEEAKRQRGRVFTLIGNHEIMNTKGSTGYVTPLGRTNFRSNANGNVNFSKTANVSKIHLNAIPNRNEYIFGHPNNKRTENNEVNYNYNYNAIKQYNAAARKRAWKPGSVLSKKYSEYPAVLKIGKFIFMHGGLRYEIAEKYKGNIGIKRMNMFMWAYMNKKLRSKNVDEFNWIFGDSKDPEKKGLLYYKLYSRSIGNMKVKCEDLEKTLKLMGCDKMIVAHVPQAKGISHDCDKQVWKTNIAMSRAFGGKAGEKQKKPGRIPSVLEIINGTQFSILKKPL